MLGKFLSEAKCIFLVSFINPNMSYPNGLVNSLT